MRMIGNEGGFTLVELLVAASLGAIGLLGLAATHVNALRATATGRNVSIATLLAAQEMEVLRRTPYDQLASVSPTGVTVGNLTYAREVTVVDSPTGTSKQVTVTTSWSDNFGWHNVPLTSVIAP